MHIQGERRRERASLKGQLEQFCSNAGEKMMNTVQPFRSYHRSLLCKNLKQDESSIPTSTADSFPFLISTLPCHVLQFPILRRKWKEAALNDSGRYLYRVDQPCSAPRWTPFLKWKDRRAVIPLPILQNHLWPNYLTEWTRYRFGCKSLACTLYFFTERPNLFASPSRLRPPFSHPSFEISHIWKDMLVNTIDWTKNMANSTIHLAVCLQWHWTTKSHLIVMEISSYQFHHQIQLQVMDDQTCLKLSASPWILLVSHPLTST